jgi:Ca2+:H+ antiporter
VTDRQKLIIGGVFALAALSLGLRIADAAGQVVFIVASFAVAGLAWALGLATEQAGESAGPRVSALLNASFGNLPEVVILVLAINAGLADIARASIIGSVIGNILLILGLSLFLGGWRHGTQRFNERLAATNASMLVLMVVLLGIPTLFDAIEPSAGSLKTLSYWTAGVLLVCYIAYLYFTFKSEGLQFADEPGQMHWSRSTAIVMLAATAVATGVVSEVLVHSIEPTIKAWGVPREFIGLIVVPFVGNVAEHFSAVKLAFHNRVDFAMGIAYGSGIQVGMLASSIAVFASLAVGQPVTLSFGALELAALGAAAIAATQVARGGDTNWLEGFQLLVIYFLVAVAFWLLG